MRVIIVGNGAAGNQAAQTLHHYNPEVEIIILSADNFPFFSPCALPDYLAGWVKRPQLILNRAFPHPGVKLEVRLGQVVETIIPDQQSIIVNGEQLSYDRLILAAGSRPVLPNVPGTHLQGNFVIKSVDDIDRILQHKPRQVVVIGSGNIGVEIAEALQLRDCEVTIIEMMPRIMPRLFDQQPAALIRGILEANGIQVYTGEKAIKVFGNSRVECLNTDRQEIACDTVIWAAGVQQNTELARTAGIEIGSLGGIKVDSSMRTNCVNVYACGDCVEVTDLFTSRPVLSLLWSSAKAQAQVAAQNCLGQHTLYPGALKVIVEEVYGTPCAAAGLLEEELDGDGLKIMEREDGKCYLRILMQGDKVAGIQSVGSLDAIGTLIALMKNQTSEADIRRMLASPFLREKMPWMLAVNKYFSSEAN